MAILKHILCGGLLLLLTACGSMSNVRENTLLRGAVLPHHLLVESFIDEFYQHLQREFSDVRKIILLSPNHFGYGLRYVQMSESPRYFPKEHGIMVHIPFIKKYFSDAEILPIILKPQTPQENLDALVKELLPRVDVQTLVLASVDFTHYVGEKDALENDARAIAWLESNESVDFEKILGLAKSIAIGKSDEGDDAVAFDSPETLYVTLKLMEAQGARHFVLWKRTSSASLMNLVDPAQNTSHVFGTFERK
ncbi:MAG: AmmeMemoRadiSam system protein B [Patescibacteria group bacterium]